MHGPKPRRVNRSLVAGRSTGEPAKVSRRMAGAPGTVTRRRAGSRRKSGPTHQGKNRRGTRLAPAVIILCALIAVVVAADHLASVGEIRSGVSVGEISLGGTTPREASVILEDNLPDRSGSLRFSGRAGTFAVARGDLGARLDVRATVEKAYSVGRRGSLPRGLAERVKSLFGVSVPAEVRLRPGATRAAAESLATRANAEPKNAFVRISGSDVRVSEAETGYELDVPATARNVHRALENLSSEGQTSGRLLRPEITTDEAEAAAQKVGEAVSGPLVLTANGKRWSISPANVGSAVEVVRRDGELRVGLDRGRLREESASVYAALTREPFEAGYDLDGGANPAISVTSGRAGKVIEEQKLFTSLESGLFEGKHEYAVPVATEVPALTTSEAESLKPTSLLGSYRTNYAVVPDTADRVENLMISSDAVDGTIVAPDEVFSMLDHVAHLDYKKSKVILRGQETTADGGGLCQVTSTMYNAANFAGLDVIERTPHSSQLPYIRPGMDATVWWGGPGRADDLDMKFRNNTGGYLLLREHVAQDGHVYAEIWGRPSGTEVSMSSKPAYLGKDGSEWVTHQTIEKDGEVLFDGVLHRDAYEPLVDKHGNEIPPREVPVAPVDP